MAYTPQTWNNNDPNTPLTATRLNYMEAGILAAGAVSSVAARSGAVVLTGADIGAGAFPALRLASQTISGTATLVTGTQALILADTTSAAFTITLPAAPTAGDLFIFEDSAAQWATHNLTLGLNGKNLNGSASNPVLVTGNAAFGIVYDGTGWHSIIHAPSDANPAMDGAAAPGTGFAYSRRDHVHPTDTSRAPLANPGLTGVPTAPTAAVDTNTTQIATAAMVLAQAAAATPLAAGVAAVGTSTRFSRGDHVHPRAYGESVLYPDGTFTPVPPGGIGSAAQTSAVNGARGTRFVCPKTGTLSSLWIGVAVSSGNIDVGIYDTNDASAGNRSRLWHSGTTACGSTNAWQVFSPALGVTAGVEYEFALAADNGTATFIKVGSSIPSTAIGAFPVANVVPGGAAWKPFGNIAAAAGVTAGPPLSLDSAITEAHWEAGSVGYFFIGQIT